MPRPLDERLDKCGRRVKGVIHCLMCFMDAPYKKRKKDFWGNKWRYLKPNKTQRAAGRKKGFWICEGCYKYVNRTRRLG